MYQYAGIGPPLVEEYPSYTEGWGDRMTQPVAKDRAVMVGGVVAVAFMAVITAGLIVAYVTSHKGSETPMAVPAPSTVTVVRTSAPDDQIVTPRALPPRTESPEINMKAFLDVLHRDGIAGSENQWVFQARMACDALDTGASLPQVLDALMSAPYNDTADQAGSIAGAGVPAFCPQWKKLIP